MFFFPLFFLCYLFRAEGNMSLGRIPVLLLALLLPLFDQFHIPAHLEEMYGAEVSPTLISSVTDAVMDIVATWQARPLDALYPIVYLDGIHVKARDSGAVRVKAVYLALGVNLEGEKELLGIWIAQTEGAKFWLQVVTELKNRGVQDIFIACVDGLKGFPEAIEAVYPKTAVQRCIVHRVRPA